MNRKRAAWRLAMLALFIIIGWKVYQGAAADFREVSLKGLAQYSPSLLPLAFSVLLLVIANLSHAVLWRRIAIDLGSPAPNTRATLHIYFVSSLSRYLVKLGQMAGLAVLAGRFGMAAGRATAAALLGQLVFMATGFILVSLAIPGLRDKIPDYKMPVDPAIVGVLLALASIAGIWFVVGTSAGRGLRTGLASKAPGRAGERLTTAFAILDEARPRHALLWSAGYAASWLVLGIAFVVFVTAFAPIPAGQTLFVAGIAAASYLGGYFSPAPAGFGVREGLMIFLLTLIPDMPLEAATMIGLSSRLWFTAGEVLPLLLIPLTGKPLVTGRPAVEAVQ